MDRLGWMMADAVQAAGLSERTGWKWLQRFRDGEERWAMVLDGIRHAAALLTTASIILLGLPFDFTNVIVLPLLFGIGIDSGIHLVHQSKLRNSTHSNLLETTTARAIFYSALTSIVSFGSFGFCSHLGLRSLGVELTAGMILTVLSVLLVLPALIQLRWSKMRIPHRDP